MPLLLMLLSFATIDLPPPSDTAIRQTLDQQAAFRMHEAQLTRAHLQAKQDADIAAKRAYTARMQRSTPSLPPPPMELCASRWFAC